MGNVKSLLERSRDFEEAHCSCRELMNDQLKKIETYTTKWMLVGFGALFLLNVVSLTIFYSQIISVKEKVDYRYSLTMETLEDIHKVKIELGRVVSDYSKPANVSPYSNSR